jgi:predicted RNA-binding Zn-ribbon protein involved in translation (DUF1610 family)
MTKGKTLSKRLTTLSLARNLTQRQEHQLVAMADRARKMEADLAEQREPVGTWVTALTCPNCGQNRILGYRLNNEKGEQMHTHYVCTFWASGTFRACGWHGWTVPGWDGVKS